LYLKVDFKFCFWVDTNYSWIAPHPASPIKRKEFSCRLAQ
jgi:hypothetical protein